jgi:hypothetical protein
MQTLLGVATLPAKPTGQCKRIDMLIQNLNYLKTAVEVLESGQATEANTIKILKIMSEICAMNVQKMTQNLVDDKSPKCYN